MRIHRLAGILHFNYLALKRNAFSIGEHDAVELKLDARCLMDNPEAYFPDRHHRTFDSGSEGKQHFAAFGEGSGQDAGDPGSLLRGVGADRLLKANLQLGSDGDRFGQGVESCKCKRREAAPEKGFPGLKTHRIRTPAEREPMVMNNYSPHKAFGKTWVSPRGNAFSL